MPRTKYLRGSGAFEVFATDDEIKMDRLQRENESLRSSLDRAEFLLSRIETTLQQRGIALADSSVDLSGMSREKTDAVARRLGVTPGSSQASTIRAIESEATPYQIWRASNDDSQQ